MNLIFTKRRTRFFNSGTYLLLLIVVTSSLQNRPAHRMRAFKLRLADARRWKISLRKKAQGRVTDLKKPSVWMFRSDAYQISIFGLVQYTVEPGLGLTRTCFAISLSLLAS